ncbi:MAG TPA: ribose-phosphate pyrophosphokinase [Planctomycetota bacterium]|nr:ribose-phosphate pyrophosphokinase [Planctomycetota bacterium]
MKDHKFQIFAGSSNRVLAADIARYLDMQCSPMTIGKFPDGETMVKVEADVRGADVFVVQSTCAPVNDNLMELLIVLDCLRRASAARITAVIPYFGYARQDRKDEGRVPITAKLAANLVATAGADRVLTMELHAAQVQGFFDIPVDHLNATPIVSAYLELKKIESMVVVSPDVGGSKLALAYAQRFGADLAIIEKERLGGSEVRTSFIIGEVKGKNAVIVDDMITTGGTVASAAELLKSRGARDIYVVATHGIFCGPAEARMTAAPFTEIAVTNTIPIDERWVRKGVKVLSVAPLLGEAMRRIHCNESVSGLFSKKFIMQPDFKWS